MQLVLKQNRYKHFILLQTNFAMFLLQLLLQLSFLYFDCGNGKKCGQCLHLVSQCTMNVTI